jgi:hypothetical protein
MTLMTPTASSLTQAARDRPRLLPQAVAAAVVVVVVAVLSPRLQIR